MNDRTRVELADYVRGRMFALGTIGMLNTIDSMLNDGEVPYWVGSRAAELGYEGDVEALTEEACTDVLLTMGFHYLGSQDGLPAVASTNLEFVVTLGRRVWARDMYKHVTVKGVMPFLLVECREEDDTPRWQAAAAHYPINQELEPGHYICTWPGKAVSVVETYRTQANRRHA